MDSVYWENSLDYWVSESFGGKLWAIASQNDTFTECTARVSVFSRVQICASEPLWIIAADSAAAEVMRTTSYTHHWSTCRNRL